MSLKKWFDNARSDVCAGEAAGICGQCGFCMAGEEMAVMDRTLRPTPSRPE